MSYFSNPFENRHYGLDFIRATSLLMILVVHSMIFIGSYYELTDYIYFGVLAVELFFALSGFLIGTILLKISKNGFNQKILLNFWLKRWMRTLPAYFTVITVIMLVNQEFYWSFLFFLQNYVPSQLNFFPVSWTISLEEWFYLTFPLLFFIAHKLFFNRFLSAQYIFLLTVLIYIIGPFIMRIFAVMDSPEALWDLYMRKRIFIRFDTIGYGLLISWINYYYSDFFYKKTIKNLSFILAISLTAFSWWVYNNNVDLFKGGLNFYNSLVFFPSVNLVCAFAIIYALNFKTHNNTFFARSVTTISITSYSLYLVHFQFFRYFFSKSENQTQAWLYMLLAITITFNVGFILNMTVEKYFINKRNSWIKS